MDYAVDYIEENVDGATSEQVESHTWHEVFFIVYMRVKKHIKDGVEEFVREHEAGLL